MGVSEVSSINAYSSYQGQGSQVKAAPVSAESSNDNNSESEVEVASSLNSKIDEYANGNALDKNQQPGSSLKEAVGKINAASSSCEAVFGIHEGTNRVMIKMVDKSTKKTIKEFPAEETLDLIAKAWELAGIMVDEKR